MKLQDSINHLNTLKQQFKNIKTQIYNAFDDIIKQCIELEYKFEITNYEGIWYVRTITPAITSNGYVIIDDEGHYMVLEINNISNIKLYDDTINIIMKQ